MPKQHREQVTGDFSSSEYLAVQSVVHREGEAIRSVLPTEGEQQLRFIATNEVVMIPRDELEQRAMLSRAAANNDQRLANPS